jgi:cytochrome c oxidase subunit 3
MRHPYHLVEPSPWPLLISLNLLFSLIGLTAYLNGYMLSLITFKLSFFNVFIIFLFWIYDIISESLYMGFHSFKVSKGLIIGFLLFVLTEIMLFFSLFWAYFHSALNPTDLIWPPVGIDLINPWSIPLLNTVLLLYSGVAATWAHHEFLSSASSSKVRSQALLSLNIAILLGLIFVALQGFEYYHSTYDITDSIYSSAFYLTTGMHGFHVIVGVSLLIAISYRLYTYHNPTIFFDLALIYYHFVDVVWIGLFILIYYLAY